MSPDYMSVATADRNSLPNAHVLDPLYATVLAENRAKVVQEEEARVEKLRILQELYRQQSTDIIHQIAQTRTRFNAMASIFRLPEELLAMVFKLYVADFWEHYYPMDALDRRPVYDKSFPDAPYSWIVTVLHVCRRWRCIAISTPRLWTVIAPARLHEQWRLDFLLEHAGNLPLTVRSDGWALSAKVDMSEISLGYYEDGYEPPKEIAFFRQVFQELPRIETLGLCATDEMVNLFREIEGGQKTTQIFFLREFALDLRRCTAKGLFGSRVALDAKQERDSTSSRLQRA